MTAVDLMNKDAERDHVVIWDDATSMHHVDRFQAEKVKTHRSKAS